LYHGNRREERLGAIVLGAGQSHCSVCLCRRFLGFSEAVVKLVFELATFMYRQLCPIQKMIHLPESSLAVKQQRHRRVPNWHF
jgi:hypothetical protein